MTVFPGLPRHLGNNLSIIAAHLSDGKEARGYDVLTKVCERNGYSIVPHNGIYSQIIKPKQIPTGEGMITVQAFQDRTFKIDASNELAKVGVRASIVRFRGTVAEVSKCFLFKMPTTLVLPYLTILNMNHHIEPTRSNGEYKSERSKSDYDAKENGRYPELIVMENTSYALNGLENCMKTSIVIKREVVSMERVRGVNLPMILKQISPTIRNVRDIKDIDGEVDAFLSKCSFGDLKSAIENAVGSVFSHLEADKPRTPSTKLQKSIFNRMNGYKNKDMKSVIDSVYADVQTIFDRAASRLSQGPKWILKNPQRQWTSSINPIITNPRDFYGEHYVPFRIFDEKIETTLRIMRSHKECPFSWLPKDVFDLILKMVIENFISYQ